LTTGLADIPPIAPKLRTRANQMLADQGPQAMLAELDQDTRRKIDTQNPARIQRAWEVLMATGRGLADWQASTGPALLPLHSAQALVLQMDTARLDARISQRFDAMIDLGALSEARAALPHWPGDGPNQPPPWTRAIGAPELIAHLRGQITLQDAIVAAKLASRQYAKRQRTWFRNRMKNWAVIDC
jgi:tRNA dimethylallyltransferase